MVIVLLLQCLAALGALSLPSAASASEISLRDRFEVSRQPGSDWTWLTLHDTRSLQNLPHRWMLHMDQVRFRRVAIVATMHDGHVERTTVNADQLQHNWSAGGVLSFPMYTAGRRISALRIGFERIDDPALLRKISALAPREADRIDDGWLLLMGLFAGLLVSAFVYNLIVFAGQRYAFQRWYLAWVGAALVYGLTWTNVAGYLVPALPGPMAVRLDSMLVGLMVALGCQFFLGIVEGDKIPRPFRIALRTLAIATFAAGAIAADERLFNAAASDALLNLMLVACVAGTILTVVIAAARGSRVVWLYLVGWAPVIAVFATRVARNFGLVGQSDAVDMATFAAMGFESLVFSLLIAGRFVSLRRQRDELEASARDMEIERETLQRAAHTDFLTGLGNRAYFHDQMRLMYERAQPFSLFLLDVDYLKELNDRLGHDAGDALLQHIGAGLAAIGNERTHCARIGGDEFAILHRGAPEEAVVYAERIDALQGTLWARHNWSGILSLSVGRAGSEGAMSPADLFQRADIALYEAKKLGRGRTEVFDDRLQEQIQSRLDLIKEAHWGLRRREFLLHFQPIIDVNTSTLVSVEALLRWNHPRHGLIGPTTFHAVLNDKEIGPAVQRHVIKLAIAELRRRRGFAGTLAVNFTSMDLRGRDAAVKLLAQLEAARISPSSLCVEVTEGIILGKAGSDPAEALRVLHKAGVRISLDDFGTGYASLLHLKEIPVDTLKIDRSFVADLLNPNRQSEEIVRAVLALGHGLKKAVVAEGVETLPQLLRLRELGCDQAQGYLFGRPAPAFPSTGAARAAA